MKQGKLKGWIFIDDELPEENGNYLVLWSEPYQKEMSAKVAYFHNGDFRHRKVGGNEILFWRKYPSFPEISKEIRSRLCNKP